MKANKKALALVLCALMLVAGSVFGTLAYLTDTATVTNTFTVGDVEITLDEQKVDLYGKPDGDTRVLENKYKLIPGHNYTKDPIVHVAEESENCYVFVRITNAIAEIEADEDKIADQMAENGWVSVDGVSGVYYYGTSDEATAVVAKTDLHVFEEFTIDGAEDAETLKNYTDTTIVVKAYAIQADGLAANDVAAIWTALKSEHADA